jgi:HEPN domain-containing protein
MDEMTHSGQIAAPEDASKLRTRGRRMLELATRAYCEQHYDFARLFTRLAAEIFAHAKIVEQSYAPCRVRVDRSRRAGRPRV